jgi:peptidoglycan/xylan/chitin deacetylase (PgdA/CDA1 family)
MRQNDIDLVLTTLKKTMGITESTSMRNFLSWGEIREMSNHGISFGSHSSTHANLTLLSEKDLLQELQGSKEKIEEKIGAPVKALSYPYGLYDERCKRAVEKIGYEIAFATKRINPSWDRFSVPRVSIKEGRSLSPLGNFSKHLFEVEYHGFHERMSSKLASLTINRLGVS